jgi:hypothetical protein
MVCQCLVYVPYPDKYENLIDVAAYDIDCKIHGWRWDYDGPILSLEEYQEIDEENALQEGYEVDLSENAIKFIPT